MSHINRHKNCECETIKQSDVYNYASEILKCLTIGLCQKIKESESEANFSSSLSCQFWNGKTEAYKDALTQCEYLDSVLKEGLK